MSGYKFTYTLFALHLGFYLKFDERNISLKRIQIRQVLRAGKLAVSGLLWAGQQGGRRSLLFSPAPARKRLRRRRPPGGAARGGTKIYGPCCLERKRGGKA